MPNQRRTEELRLPPNGKLALISEFFSAAQANLIQAQLIQTLAWEQRTIRLFGREVVQPRLLSWAGSVAYTYSNHTLPARQPTALLQELIERVSARAQTEFNHVLVNRYRNGQDYMGWHSDDEPELGRCPSIASLSFGVTRRFLLKAKRRSQDPATHELRLTHGSLLLMRGDLQHHYRHSVPKQSRVTDERLNLTFRFIQH